MWRSKKFILVAVLAVIVLVGSIGGVVFAQTGSKSPAGVVLAQSGSGDDSQPKALFGARLYRVCEIYEDITGETIDCAALKEAFAQARSERRDEAQDRYLQRLVAQDKITEEQADQYRAWLEAKPDMPLPGPFRCFGFHDGFRGGMRWGGPPPAP